MAVQPEMTCLVLAYMCGVGHDSYFVAYSRGGFPVGPSLPPQATWTVAGMKPYYKIITRSQIRSKRSEKRRRRKKKKKMGNAKVLLVVLVIAVSARTCRSLGEEVANSVQQKAEEVQQAAPSAFENAKDTSESWANWAYDKFSETVGLKKDEGDQQVAETQKISTDESTATKVQGAATDAYNKAGEQMQTAKDKASEMVQNAKEQAANVVVMASETASGAKEGVKDKVSQATENVGEAAKTAKDTVIEKAESADVKGKVSQATQTVGEAAKIATDSVTEKAESVQQTVSQSPGNL
ncbi:uncharacterized protein LOC129311456 [Prosopis cineraria]|uniref:uncharacterized protein LOC129311456 n=1 Tax=Prosopis cineraria TaxID=364024 RepID=UPI00240FDDB3|nr:uncharacterized protein LOC129311456 [Prosopis cineraria]